MAAGNPMQRIELETYYVQIVTSFPGGEETAETIRFNSKAGAIAECERLQFEFDSDAEPRRAYVLDSGLVRIHAGGEIAQTQRPPRKAAR